jgi:acetyl-CoA carboxylase biotin carboxyl carrier protein
MDSLPLSLEELRQLVDLFESHRLTELEWREGGVRVRLQAAPKRQPSKSESAEDADEHEAIEISAPSGFPPTPAAEPTPEEKGWSPLPAPMTGTFYRAAGPGDPPLVEESQPVEPDQVVGLIEAMKIFSEIRSEVAGTVMEIPAHNGQMVQAGQVLVWILPD